METILIVDDEQFNLTLLGHMLSPHYKLRTASSGEEALAAMASPPRPAIVLLDVMMPGMDGYEVLRRAKQDASVAGIPVILVSALGEPGDEEMGLLLGAVDYIVKPVKPAVLLARVKGHLTIRTERDALAARYLSLESLVRRQTQESVLLQSVAGNIIGSLAEAGNPGTGKHLRRVQGYVNAICTDLASNPRFSETLTPLNIQLIVKAVPMYDIGMLLVPAEILRKPGTLTAADWEVIRGHCQLGSSAIAKALTVTSQPPPFLRFSRDCALSHHERWDGSGYPQGLSGEKIPLAARIVGLSDAFDAMIGRRPFQEAFDIIFQGRGTLFDPDVVDAFLAQFDAIAAVADREADTPEETQARMARLGRVPSA